MIINALTILLSVFAFLLILHNYFCWKYNVDRVKVHAITETELESKISKIDAEVNSVQKTFDSRNAEMDSAIESFKKYENDFLVGVKYAERIQRSVIPNLLNLKKVFPQSFVYYAPRDIVSGDFYTVAQLEKNDVVVVADCTGHGVPGACLSVLGIAMLNSIIARVNPETITAAEILNTLRTRISESLTRGETEDGDMHDGMDIALCIINRKTRRVSYSGAYRPVWVLNHGEITEWKPDRMPIAVDTDHNDDFTNHEFQIKPDDRIYLFTDGLTDQFGMKSPGKLSKFMGKRLRMLLQEICDDEAETQKIKIEKTMESWADKQQQTDDMLIIGLLDL